MARFSFFFLFFLGILALQAMADKSEAQHEGVKPKGVEAEEKPALSPLQEETESREAEAEAPEIRRLGKHHSYDKSVAGGGVIIGGLATATFAAVFCYIKVTRKRHGDQGGK
uniref:Transmembrane protein n=1 Tax=Populus davidiana TaxID=266767 RepID=A0A6M2EGA8_9ROSI